VDRIGILTSGGDGPGMNAAIRAAVRTASRHGVETVGYLDGFQGLINAHYRRLDDRTVGNTVQRGGTILGTSRCPEFLEPAYREKAASQMRRDRVEALVVVGGDGSFKGALALQEEQSIKVAGVPGTIDNDVWGTEESIGFHTAVQTAVRAIDQLRDTSESTGMLFFVEVMGRSSGAIALHTALAAGATGVLVPETEASIEEIAERIRRSEARGKRSHIIVVSEGDQAGGAFDVARGVSKLIDHEHRVVVLGHIQRGGDPVPRDRIVAAVSGALAVEALVAGRTGMMIGMQGGKPVEVPLAEVVRNGKPPPDYHLIGLAEKLSG
jgi:6-phosphofructokinase 1